MKTEFEWDKKLNINTVGRDATLEDSHHYPYEPTPYSVLERLVDSDYITCENRVVDYGSGKGRVGFFLNDQIGCKVLGIDFDERMDALARENLKKYGDNLTLWIILHFIVQQNLYLEKILKVSVENW